MYTVRVQGQSAIFQLSRTQPLTRDKLIILVMIGARVSTHLFSNHVGIGFNWQLALEDEENMSRVSVWEKGEKCVSFVWGDGVETVGRGIEKFAISSLVTAILRYKNSPNSSASWCGLSCGGRASVRSSQRDFTKPKSFLESPAP